MRFTGEYLDQTGLYHLRARQYDPGIGRFTAHDPWPTSAVSPYASSYSYVQNQPTVLTDPTGLVPRGSKGGHQYSPDFSRYRGDMLDTAGAELLAEGLEQNLMVWVCAPGVTCVQGAEGWVPGDQSRIALGHFIFFEGLATKCGLRHELKHVEQYGQLGTQYLDEYVFHFAEVFMETGDPKLAYRSIPFEVPAERSELSCLGINPGK